MADTLGPAERSALMSRIRAKDTKPEWRVRRLVHGMGYRYRLHRRSLPGTPDLVFPARRKVIFVHGCFWHWHPDPACRLAGLPRSRLEFWAPKLERNQRRDVVNLAELSALGWWCGNAGRGVETSRGCGTACGRSSGPPAEAAWQARREGQPVRPLGPAPSADVARPSVVERAATKNFSIFYSGFRAHARHLLVARPPRRCGPSSEPGSGAVAARGRPLPGGADAGRALDLGPRGNWT